MFKQGEKSFYLNDDNNKLIAEITYSVAGDKLLIIDHTFVDPVLRGQGIAGKLVKAVVDLAIKQNRKIVPLCPFAKREFENKEEYHTVWHR